MIKMNKTISINIAGFVFNIEEQAYDKLENYLNSIRTKFKDEAEREEIMEDIEARIAELFQEKVSDTKAAIVLSDVTEVIDIMGKPEDYADEENAEGEASEESDQGPKTESTYSDTSQKRLFRDTDNEMIGGVCAGLGHFFNLDPTIVRIIFVLLVILGGSGILLYLILLLVVPEAKSTADKLQMKGRKVNLDNIKEHVYEFKAEFQDSAKSGAKQVKDNVKRAAEKVATAGGTFVQTFSKIIGIAFVAGGAFALIALITVFFGNSGLLPIVGSDQIEDLPTFIEILYPGTTQHFFIFLSIMVVTLLPVISIFITGIKLLFDIRKTVKPLAITGFAIWILGVGTLAITGIELGMNFKNHNQVEYNIPLDRDSADLLIIDVQQDEIFSSHIKYNQVWNHTELIRVKNDRIYMGFPKLHILQRMDSSDFRINLYKESAGLSIKEAVENADNTEYTIDVSGNKVLLPPYYSMATKDKIRGQEITVEIEVPLGKEIRFGNNIDRICVWLEGQAYFYSEYNDYSGTVWRSNLDGLSCKDCADLHHIHEFHDIPDGPTHHRWED